MRAMGVPGRLDHLAPVIRAGEDFQSFAQDLVGSPDNDARAVTRHGRGVVLLLAGDRMVEDLRQSRSQRLRATHAARFRDKYRSSRHEISNAIRESEEGC